MKICPKCLLTYEDDQNTCIKHDGLVASRPGSRTIDEKYLLIRQIGRGGVGAVYEAEHIDLGRRVAVKLILPELTSDETLLERFHREARAAGRLDHPNVASVYDYGKLPNGEAFLVMDLVLGITLRDYMRELGAIPLSECREIAMQVASGIAAAHKEGIVHRDLKPSNIILSRDKNSDVWAKVVDFGIAKINEHTLTTLNTLTAIGTLMGTPRYMSPEQCSGKEVDSRSDIYSLGIIIYEMFAGRPPFDAPSPMALALKHIQEQPVSLGELRPGLPREIVALVMQMLDKDPDRRPGSAMEIYHKFSDLSLKETQHQVLSSSQKSGLTHTWIQKHLAYMIPVLLLLFSAGLLAGLYLFRGSSGTGTQDEREPAAVVYREEERPAINEKKEQENRAGERDAGPVKEPDKVREREGRGDLESPRRELRNQLTRWVAATNSGNVKGQMSFYMPRVHAFYRARNVPRSSVRAEKARLTANASSINISTSEPQITISEDGRSAIMLFRKSYQIESSSESRQGEVLQELRWIKTDSGWKITSERDLRVL